MRRVRRLVPMRRAASLSAAVALSSVRLAARRAVAVLPSVCAGSSGLRGRAGSAGSSARGAGTFPAPPPKATATLGCQCNQLAAFRFGERLRIAILRYFRVLLAVRDVRAVAAVEHLQPAAEVGDDPVRIRFLFETDHLERPLERDRVGIVASQA